MRDDYANLHEAHEQPGRVLVLCASQGRPVYGWLLERSCALLLTIDSFVWARMAGTLLWALTAATLVATLIRQLRRRTAPALALAALLLALAGVQVETLWGGLASHLGSRAWDASVRLRRDGLGGGWPAARHNSRLYLADAQAAKLRRIEAAAVRVEHLPSSRVFLWLPEPSDTVCVMSHLDEFGSLSGDCEWAAKEMLLQLVRGHAHRPGAWDLPLQISIHYAAPLPKLYGMLIDVRTHG